MSGIAGILLLGDGDADAMFEQMLKGMKHRGRALLHKVGNSQGTGIIAKLGCERRAARGSQGQSAVVDSPLPAVSEALEDAAADLLVNSRPSGLHDAAVAGFVKNGLRIYRSIEGTRPVYYAPLERGFAFASERKSLWSLATGFVRPIEPGEIVTLLWNGASDSRTLEVRKRPVVDTVRSESELISMLIAALEGSFSRLKHVRNAAVLFSGGIDSSVAALMTSRVCKSTSLFTATTSSAKDSRAAEAAAKQLNLEHRTVYLNHETVWRILPSVIYAIESTNRMDVEIAIPFFLAAGEAKSSKKDVVISGQGPDELFAGYAKHLAILRDQGEESLRNELWAAVSRTHEVNIARDERAIAHQRIPAFFPFLHSDFVDIALRIPTSMLITTEGKESRKNIFRSMAKRLGLPTRLTGTPKHATQYSSGSAKVLLQAVKANVSEAKKVGKRDAERMVQDVLDYIGNEIGVAPQFGFVREFDMDLGPTIKLLKRVRP